MRTGFLFLAAAWACLATTLSAQGQQPAQQQGFAINRFDVSEPGSDWFSGDSLDLRGEGRPALRLTLDWAHEPLLRYDDAGEPVATIIEDQVFAHLGGAVILWDRLRLAASVPILLVQNGQETTINGMPYAAATGAGLGDLRVAADVRLVGEYGDVFTLAAGTQLFLPSGDRDAFAGDGTVRLSPRVMVAGDIALLAYSARMSLAIRPQDEGLGSVATGSEVAFVATAGVRVADGKLLLGPELWGSTVVSEGGAAFSEETTPFELLFGGHYQAGDLRFGLGVGPGLTRGVGAPSVRVVGNVTFVPDASDRDDDGIIDSEDACPDVAGPEHDDPKKHGCPDRDGDDIIDPDDACPDTPGVFDPDPTKNGCPPDTDGDGIIDNEDACPDTPGVASDDPEKHGCPPDRDDDGIIDDEDACPDTPGVEDPDPDKNGCPPDRDGDGILDQDDACPDVPGVANEDPEMHGCPIARVEKDEIKITQRIEFETDKARILPESEGVMQAVLAILQEYDDIREVRVEGHTDDVGKPAYNFQLSNRRAESVVQWLVDHGIDRDRLVPQGFGLERPIADNDTPEGRQKNRRVEFHITERDDDDTDEDDDAVQDDAAEDDEAEDEGAGEDEDLDDVLDW
ncbi:MAG: OmpA family protein [Myxococcales bacterium]|jgi:outer membrane protein OmpA-like peptidoglycan-associated protein